MVILDGKSLANRLKNEIAEKIQTEYIDKKIQTPTLAVILVGDNPASQIYVSNKKKVCDKLGISFNLIKLDAGTNQKELNETIIKLNKDEKVKGILLQLPIPKQLNPNESIDLIDYQKDVDGLTTINQGKLFKGETDSKVPCTPLGVMKLLDEYKIDFESKNIVIVGRSNLVGKPLAQLCLQRNATVTLCHSKTKNLSDFTKTADIIISAVGQKKLITADMIKSGVVVVDIGINRNPDGSICGDVDFEEVSKKASYITPVPGGIGPMTIAMLLDNLLS